MQELLKEEQDIKDKERAKKVPTTRHIEPDEKEKIKQMEKSSESR
jgi:hypothetical protein